MGHKVITQNVSNSSNIGNSSNACYDDIGIQRDPTVAPCGSGAAPAAEAQRPSAVATTGAGRPGRGGRQPAPISCRGYHGIDGQGSMG